MIPTCKLVFLVSRIFKSIFLGVFVLLSWVRLGIYMPTAHFRIWVDILDHWHTLNRMAHCYLLVRIAKMKLNPSKLAPYSPLSASFCTVFIALLNDRLNLFLKALFILLRVNHYSNKYDYPNCYQSTGSKHVKIKTGTWII